MLQVLFYYPARGTFGLELWRDIIGGVAMPLPPPDPFRSGRGWPEAIRGSSDDWGYFKLTFSIS